MGHYSDLFEYTEEDLEYTVADILAGHEAIRLVYDRGVRVA